MNKPDYQKLAEDIAATVGDFSEETAREDARFLNEKGIGVPVEVLRLYASVDTLPEGMHRLVAEEIERHEASGGIWEEVIVAHGGTIIDVEAAEDRRQEITRRISEETGTRHILE